MGTGKKKIEIKRKEKEQDRMVAFSKRRKGLFKKAHQLHALSGAKIALVVFSPAGKPYICGDPCFNDIVDKYYYGGAGATTNAAADDNAVMNINSKSSTYGADKDRQDIQVLKSILDRMDFDRFDNVDDLLLVQNNLEQVRDKVIQSIGDTLE